MEYSNPPGSREHTSGSVPASTAEINEYITVIEKLRRSEERLQKVMSIETVGMFYFAPDGSIHAANKAFERMSGYAMPDLATGRIRCDAITAPEFKEATHRSTSQLFSTGQNTPYEKQYIRPDGTRWWALCTGKKLSENEYVEFVLDINEMKESQLALSESEARFRTLSDAVPQVIWTNDGEGRANYFNQRWYDYTGLTYQESYGLGWEIIIHPDDAASSVKRWHSALHELNPFETEFRLRRADGVYRWHIGRNVPLKDSNGEVIAWFGSATDIEAIKVIEQSERESREQMSVTMQSAEDYAIITLDIHGNILGWSRGAELLFQYRAEEAVGKYTDLIYTTEDRADGVPRKEIQTALSEGSAPDERWHIRRDGSRLYLSGVMRPIYNPEPAGFVKVARDETNQKMAEELKDQFIGIASHELKTPVTSIKAMTELVQEQLETENHHYLAKLVSKINGQVDRLTKLIRDLLDTSKLVEGQLPLELEEFSLQQQIEQCVEELKRISGGHEFRLDFRYRGTVLADRDRIGQVLTNLITNAIKYSDPGTLITITTEAVGKDARVSVEDQGMGIPESVRSKVFDRFFRVESEKLQTYPGMGLGLYIASGIIQRHGGSISVQSQEGRGSIFSFILPGKII